MPLQAVELMIEPRSLSTIKMAVCPCARFVATHTIKLLAQPVCLSPVQGPRSNAVLNSLVSPIYALVDPLGNGC
jgi:hypothetical protein